MINLFHGLRRRLSLKHHRNDGQDRRSKTVVVDGSSNRDDDDDVHNAAVRAAFTGKTVLLTGALSGLGRSLAMQLVTTCGVQTLFLSDVIDNDSSNSTALHQLAATCQALSAQRVASPREEEEEDNSDPSLDSRSSGRHVNVHVVPCDLADPDDVNRLADHVLELNGHRPIDILIHNGGFVDHSRLWGSEAQIYAALMQINFLSGATLAETLLGPLGRDDDDDDDNDGITHIVSSVKGAPRQRLIWISSTQTTLCIPTLDRLALEYQNAVDSYCEVIRQDVSSGIAVHTIIPGYIRNNISPIAGDGSCCCLGSHTEAVFGADPEETAAEILQRVAVGEDVFGVALNQAGYFPFLKRLKRPSLLRWLPSQRRNLSVMDNLEPFPITEIIVDFADVQSGQV